MPSRATQTTKTPILIQRRINNFLRFTCTATFASDCIRARFALATCAAEQTISLVRLFPTLVTTGAARRESYVRAKGERHNTSRYTQSRYPTPHIPLPLKYFHAPVSFSLGFVWYQHTIPPVLLSSNISRLWGEDAGSKLDKARALGVKTLTEKEFLEMLR